jgi:cell division transport system permease protein
VTGLRAVFLRALGGLRAAPFVHAVAALTVALALVLAGLAAGAGLAARALLDAWGVGSEFTVYLADGLPDAEGAGLRARVEELAGAPARLVPPAAALARLKTALGADAALLDDLPANPLPASIEVRPAAADPGAREALAVALRRLPGVADVDRGQLLDARLAAVGDALRTGGAALLAVILLGAAALAGSAVRLGVWARREEIAILRLVGATPAFVRAPFLVEGLLAGLAGGVVAAAALLALAHRAAPIARGLPLPDDLAPLALASPGHLVLVVVAGAALGLLASAVSVGRHLRG